MISVIIPVYNAEKTLKRLCDSLDEQTYRDFEVIFIDDGSKDDSLNMLNAYASLHDNVEVIHVENGGQGRARNIGMEKAKGEYITFIDSDDYVLKDYLKHMIIATKEDVMMVTSSLKREFAYKPSFLETHFQYNKPIIPKTGCITEYPQMMLEIINGPVCKLINRNFLKENHIVFPEGIAMEDLAFTHSIISKNVKIVMTDHADYIYIVRKGSTMTSNKKIYDLFKAMDYAINGYKDYPECKMTLDYYLFHHIGIGGLYRTYQIDRKHLFEYIQKAKDYLKENDCDLKHNAILKKQNVIIKMIAKWYE